MKRTSCALGAAAGLVLSAFALERPVPVVTESGAKEGAVAALNRGEASAACEVKFGALPSTGSVTGLFGLAADAEGRVTLTLPAAKTALEGDVVIRSREKVAAGEWHQYAFSYSMIRQRVAFYLDGRLQFENDNVNLPWPGFGEPTVAAGFGGSVRNFRGFASTSRSDSRAMS